METAVLLSLLSHGSHLKVIVEGISFVRELLPQSHIVAETSPVINLESLKSQSDVLHALVEDLTENERAESSAAIHVCLSQLADTMTQIQNNFEQIDKTIHEHNKKWFNYFRSYSVEEPKERLAKLAPKLDEQMDRLIKILAIPN